MHYIVGRWSGKLRLFHGRIFSLLFNVLPNQGFKVCARKFHYHGENKCDCIRQYQCSKISGYLDQKRQSVGDKLAKLRRPIGSFSRLHFHLVIRFLPSPSKYTRMLLPHLSPHIQCWKCFFCRLLVLVIFLRPCFWEGDINTLSQWFCSRLYSHGMSELSKLSLHWNMARSSQAYGAWTELAIGRDFHSKVENFLLK